MSNIVTQLPGFQDSIHDSQRTFRALLNANSRPGKPYQINAEMTVPVDLIPACGAAALTLLDLDVFVWLQPNFSDQVKAWLLFHTGCRFTEHPEKADFALIQDLEKLPELSIFKWGTAEKPETSTTLLIQVESFATGKPVTLTGAGILEKQLITPTLPQKYWDLWKQNYQAYPQGLDVFLFTKNLVMGLPRTAKAEVTYDH
ncbi:phosphonate C-P lyase system protein PhnH [Nodularia harveyana UHCC-0300]|uniref:Phosphonate C-P lyase system protein PhnH n=1 Tax=Nodularia harveyana UHCC-0300 TaxID=2974287 RepID=A0ABU5UD75_9CYAN|nr:phosphonate C-P lyase system protein PhnH [Nodularia harveyana]MEA5581489.1 phosphonate C-P lyase system protein PhnH [Nodularia harveyana UHCC-0300]